MSNMSLLTANQVRTAPLRSETREATCKTVCVFGTKAAKQARKVTFRKAQLAGLQSSSHKQQQWTKSSRREYAGVICQASPASVVETPQTKELGAQVTVVMKFGGSSLATAERLREVAKIVLSFPEQNPALVLSAMGKTTNDLLLAGTQALESEAAMDNLEGLTTNLLSHQKDMRNKHGLCELGAEYMCTMDRIRDLHIDTCDELGVDIECVSGLLGDLERLLLGIALMKELSPRTNDLLVSFGERMSTRIMAEYLKTLGAPAKQYDAWEIGIKSNDDFMDAEVDIEAVLPTIKETLTTAPDGVFHIPVITGFLAKGNSTGAITTLGRGGSDLSATLVGAGLGLDEVQVWKDVDGILSTDPRKVPEAVPVPFLTFEEATELAFFGATVLHPQAMRPARFVDMPVRVKNSYNPKADGTLITGERDMTGVLLTSLVLKNNVTLVDVVSERKLGFIGFASSVFGTLKSLSISTDVVATSEASITASLDPAQLWSRDLTSEEHEEMKQKLEATCKAKVEIITNKAIISLIGNVNRTAQILQTVFRVFHENEIQVDMISQGASKVNISLVVDAEEAQKALQLLHSEFFE